MSDFTREEELGLLKRGLTRRLKGKNPAIKQKEDTIKEITKTRQEYVDRIGKYADDEVVVKLLSSQLSEFDRQYSGTKQNYLLAIEEIRESEPTTKKLLKYIDKIESGNKDGTLLYMFLDLFAKPMLTDWHQMEEDKKKEESNGENNG